MKKLSNLQKIIILCASLLAIIFVIVVCAYQVNFNREVERKEKLNYEMAFGEGSYERRSSQAAPSSAPSDKSSMSYLEESDKRAEEIADDLINNHDYLPFADEAILSQLETMSVDYGFSELVKLKVMNYKHKETDEIRSVTITLTPDETLTVENASATAVSFFDFVESSWLISGIADVDCESVTYKLKNPDKDDVAWFLFNEFDGVRTCSSPVVFKEEFKDTFKNEYKNNSVLQMLDGINAAFKGLS